MSRKHPFSISRLVRYAAQGVVLGLVVTSLIIFFTSDANTFAQLKSFPVHYLPLMFGMVGLAWVCIGTRIWVITRSMGYRLHYRDALAMGLSSEFGVAASPAGVGGLAVRLAFLHRAGIPMHDAFTVFAADSVLDVIFCSFLVPVTLVVAWNDPTWKDFFTRTLTFSPAMLAIPVIVILLGVLAVLRRRPLIRWGARMAVRLPGSKRFRLPARFRHLQHAVSRNIRLSMRGVRFLLHAKRSSLLVSLALSMVQWLCRYGILPLILFAFGTHRNPVPLLLIQGLFFAIALIMVLPGGGGGIELLTTALLRYFVPMSLVGVVVLVWRVFTYYLYLVAGGIVFSLSFHRRARMHRVGHVHATRDDHHRARDAVVP